MEPSEPLPVNPSIPPASHRFPISLFLALIAFILLLSTGFLAYQNMKLQKQILALKTTPSPTPTPILDETANWKTYTNQKYGYLVKYPPDWKYTETDDPGLGDGPLSYTTFIPTNIPPKDSQTFTIIIDRKNWTEYKKGAVSIGGFKPFNFNGTNALIFDQPGYDKQISFNSPSQNTIIIGYSGDLGEKNMKITDQILSTFKFLDEPSKCLTVVDSCNPQSCDYDQSKCNK